MAAVLASLIQGLMNAGGWAPWLMHKQLKETKVRPPSEPWMHTGEINKEEMLSCILYSPASCRKLRYLEQSIGDLPCQRPNQNWMQGPVGDPLYIISLWHYGNNVTIICLFLLAGNTWHIHSRVMLTHLYIPRHPCLTPCIPAWPAKLNFIPNSNGCDTFPQVFLCALVPEPVIY